MVAEGNDMPAHEKGYGLFIWLMKWGAVASAIVTLLVMCAISN